MENKGKLTKMQIILIAVVVVGIVLFIIFLPEILIFLAILVMALGYLTGHDSFPK